MTNCEHRWRFDTIEPARPGQARTAHLTCRDCPATQDVRTLRTDTELALDRWLSAETDHHEAAAA